MSGFDQAFANLFNKIETLQTQSLASIAVLSERHYRDSFKQQGFVDQSLTRWAPNKKNTTTLVQTGQLRGSIRSFVQNQSVIVISDRPYAKYHNEGLGNNPKRQFIGRSIVLNAIIKNQISFLAKKLFS